jgi:arylesterase/paraoxonase
MSTPKKVGLMILVGVIYFIFDTVLQSGGFKQVENKFDGIELRTFRGIWGPEDLEWDREEDIIYISALDRWAKNGEENNSGDGIYILDAQNNNANPELMETDYPLSLKPHGISFFKVDGQKYMYVVNHGNNTNTVELFQVNGSFLKHIKSYSDRLMFRPNDVVGDEIDKFYVTNDHGNSSKTGRKIEDYLRMPYSYLLYYNGEKYRKVHQGMVYANGVNLSNDGSKLYVSHSTGHEIFILDRDKPTGDLKLRKTLDLDTGVDNIDVDENDVIWVAAHPKLLQFVMHAKDSTEISPSQFFKIQEVEGKYKVKKLYENDGTQISGSSVVVVKNDIAFVGNVFQDKILKLEL